MDANLQPRPAVPADAPDPVVVSAAPLAAAVLHSRFPRQREAEPVLGATAGLDLVAPHVDAAFYRACYPDIARDAVDPATHYHCRGWREGRNPNGWFDTVFYLQNYADVADAGLDPLLHYVAHGRAGGRQPRAAVPAAGAKRQREDRDLAVVAAEMDLV